MYKTFRVKNFRCFKDLQINDLGRVNLIAGKNNTGKTALLEAMYFNSKPLSPQILIDLQVVRGLQEPDDNIRAYWKQFFYAMDTMNDIRLEMTDSSSESNYAVSVVELAAEEPGAWPFDEYSRYMQKQLDTSLGQTHKLNAEIDAILEVSVVGYSHNLGPAFYPSKSKFPPRSFPSTDLRSEFIPVQGRPNKTRELERFSKLDANGKTELLIDVLKDFEPHLGDLRLSLPDGITDIWARVNGTLLPLKAMGEGVNRICHILVTMLSDLDYLFIDEIENGIHYSAQKKVWEAIGQLARELDIQVFATTHSYEMIRAAFEAFKDDDLDDFRFHRLYHDSTTGKIEARTYNEFSINAALSREYEVRG